MRRRRRRRRPALLIKTDAAPCTLKHIRRIYINAPRALSTDREHVRFRAESRARSSTLTRARARACVDHPRRCTHARRRMRAARSISRQLCARPQGAATRSDRGGTRGRRRGTACTCCSGGVGSARPAGRGSGGTSRSSGGYLQSVRAGMMRELDTVSPVVWPAWCYSGQQNKAHPWNPSPLTLPPLLVGSNLHIGGATGFLNLKIFFT